MRALALVVGGALAALTTACGSSSGSDPTTGAQADGDGGSGPGPTTTVTVDVKGAVTVDGTATAPPMSSNGVNIDTCAQYGKGETGDDGESTFRLPQMLKQAVGGRQVQVFAVIKDYKGPGSYPTDQISDVAGVPGIGVDGKQYLMTSDATATATVDANGGGKWTFTNLSIQSNDSTQSSGQLSGSVTWTCSNS